jgi:hypothetical protein
MPDEPSRERPSYSEPPGWDASKVATPEQIAHHQLDIAYDELEEELELLRRATRATVDALIKSAAIKSAPVRLTPEAIVDSVDRHVGKAEAQALQRALEDDA